MRRKLYFLWMFALILLLSCDDDKKDTPQISSFDIQQSVYMADSIPYSVSVNASYPMKSIKVGLYYYDDKVFERIIPVNNAGTYGAKLYIPFAKDLPDGSYELKIMANNRDFDYSTSTASINIVRPKFSHLTLKTQYGDYTMEPVAGEPYRYAVTSAFPSNEFNGIIEAPAYGTNGNSFYFGGKTIRANALETDSIPFLSDAPEGTEYTVWLDILSYEAEPFIMPSFDGIDFPEFQNDIAAIEKEMQQNQTIAIRGFKDIADWWIDPSFLDTETDGTYTFVAKDGKYRITADSNLKYMKVEPMNGDELAGYNDETGEGTIWVNGNSNIGIPSYTLNPINWNGAKNIAMAPLGDRKYRIKLRAEGGGNLNPTSVNFKFFKDPRSTANGFISTALTTTSTVFRVDDSSSDNGNIKPRTGSSIPGGVTYILTIDTSILPAVLTVTEE